MPWIREAPLRDLLPDLEPGMHVVRRYWPDEDPPHRYKGSFHKIDKIDDVRRGKVRSLTETTEKDRVEIVTHYYKEDSRYPQKLSLHYGLDEIVAVVEMKRLSNSDAVTYAHHDDRLILPGGYMNAHPGTMWARWDVFADNVGMIAKGVSVSEGRELLTQGVNQ